MFLNRACLVCAFTLLSQAADPDHLVADFEGKNPLKRWTFSNGEEFPGASGSLTTGPGHTGQGAVLEYRFYCDRAGVCGRYVAANWKPDARIEARKIAAVSMWARCSADVTIRVRLKDQNGQTLQFNADPFTLEHRQEDEWRQIVVALSPDASSGHWGGDDNGWSRGKIAELGILVEARYAYPSEGTVGLDDIEFMSSIPSTFRLEPDAPLAPAPQGAEQFGSRLGVNDHLLRDERSLDAARDAGFKFVRMDLRWPRVERDGEFRFAPVDRSVDAIEARGLGALVILGYGHPDHGGDVPRSPEDTAAFARYAENVAAHFKGRGIRYEIWNEPDIARFWKPQPDPQAYAALLREAVPAIRRGDPAARICTGGLAHLDLAFAIPLLQSGAASDVNAIGLHPYSAVEPEAAVADLISLRKMIHRAIGAPVEVWATEWGYSSYRKNTNGDGHSAASRNHQASLAVREALTAWALGLPLTIWYDLRDDGGDARNAEHNFGLIDQQGAEKPAMKMVRAFTEAVGNRSYVGLIRDTPPFVHAMRLEGEADNMVVVWSEKNLNSNIRLEFSGQNFVSAKNAIGAPIQAAMESGNAMIALDQQPGPLYLVFKR